MPTPLTPPEHLPSRGTGNFYGQATGLPDGEGPDREGIDTADWGPAESADWNPAELTDWDSVDWEPVEPTGWEPVELADWNPAEQADWDPAELADWEPGDPEEEPGTSAMPEPGAPGRGANRTDAGRARERSREAPKPASRARARGDGGWFAAGGIADDLPPGPRLAEFMADARAIGLGRLTDDELIGLMRAARRLASWSGAMELAAAGDLWRRRWAEEQGGNAGAACHTDDEIAAALTLTKRAADQVLSLAIALRRLPLTSRALTAGDIDLPRAMVIADEVTGLNNEHAAAVEQTVIDTAAGQTTGQLRAATRRAVLSADPQAARKRKERALQDARVERWDEHGGTAALAGRDLPPASVLAADKNLSALARQLKRAGAPGTLDQLRAQVYLALLTGSPVGSLIPASSGAASGAPLDGSARGFAGLGGDSPARAVSDGSCAPDGRSASGGPGTRAGSGLSGAPGISASPGTYGTFASPGIYGSSGSPGIPVTPGAFFGSGTVNLTMPLTSWLGLSEGPGTVAGFGPVDADDSRAIADALAKRADTRWCLTLTDSHGRPVAHGCARSGPPPGQRRVKRPAGPPSAPETGSRAGPVGSSPRGKPADCARDGPADTPRDGPADGARDGPGAGAPSEREARGPHETWTFRLTFLAGGSCDHARETAAYRPSPGLRHLVEIRHATCTYPGCRRPATQCDADHTVAYHRGGKTCLCNLAPLCRIHHRAKQAPGWQLTQDHPGVMTWRLPSGRTYRTAGDPYPA